MIGIYRTILDGATSSIRAVSATSGISITVAINWCRFCTYNASIIGFVSRGTFLQQNTLWLHSVCTLFALGKCFSRKAEKVLLPQLFQHPHILVYFLFANPDSISANMVTGMVHTYSMYQFCSSVRSLDRAQLYHGVLPWKRYGNKVNLLFMIERGCRIDIWTPHWDPTSLRSLLHTVSQSSWNHRCQPLPQLYALPQFIIFKKNHSQIPSLMVFLFSGRHKAQTAIDITRHRAWYSMIILT